MPSMKPLVALVGETSSEGDLVASIERGGFRVVREDEWPEEARVRHLQESRPALLMRTGAAGSSRDSPRDPIVEAARRLGIPLLEVIEDGSDPESLADRHGAAD